MELVIDSALSDDMLLQVLVRLHCVRAAARTSLLSRRWRGLWARLPGLTFRGIPASVIKSALAYVARRTAVSLLEIRPMSTVSGKLDDAHAKSLLRSAARLSPEEVVFVLPWWCPVKKRGRPVTIVLPCFQRATSIELDTRSLRIVSPPVGDLPMLETLSISGKIVDVGALLSRCPRLRVLRITFRGAAEHGVLEAELTTLEAAAAALGLAVSRLGIEFDDSNLSVRDEGAGFASLLRVAAKICPRELFFTFTSRFPQRFDEELPCFHRTMSIEMNYYAIRFTQLPVGEFSALERLDVKGCTITDLATMIIRCPRLRVLKVTADRSARYVTVHSVSLEELDLDVERDTDCSSIHIMTPLLKKLKLNVNGKMSIRVSISAPMVEKVSWLRTYTSISAPLIFGVWWLQRMWFDLIESYKHKDEEGVCSQLPRVHILSMDIYSYVSNLGAAVDIAHEMEKLLVTKFSVSELHLHFLSAKGHFFGAFVLWVLRMCHIRTTTQKLKIFLPWQCEMPQASQCLGNCPCDEPKDWRSQSTPFTRLEEVEIDNFKGGEHEIDFVRLIFRWAPMLTRMIIRLAYGKKSEIAGCATTINNICLAHPSVNCFVDLSQLW